MRIATASVRTGFAMTPLTRSAGERRDTWVPPYSHTFCRAGPACPAGSAVRNRRADRGVRPYGSATRGAMGGRPQGSPLRNRYKRRGKTGRCGERTERCRWQRKRSERVAAVKILSVRRKAAQKFWAPQQDHRPLRKVIDGAVCGGTHESRPTRHFCRAGPACPAGGAAQGRRVGFIECVLSS